MADQTAESATTGPSQADETRQLEEARVVRTAGTDELRFRPGDQIGRYVILRELGSGGMSVVYVAYDPQLDRHIALKLVRPGGAFAASESAPRLQREAQALARLSHPNVVHVYDVGTFGRSVYIAMELVDGKTLRQWLHEEPRPWTEVLELLIAAGEGLAAAHDAGLVHFDFKPSNVLVGAQGRVRVVDFGLAREPRRAESSADEEPPPPSHRSGRLSEPLTEHGSVMGTPGYISPEHLKGDPADARADQFAFCVTLWQGVYGDRPFVGRNRQELQKAIKQGRIRAPPADTKVPQWLCTVLRRGMSVDPNDRYPTLRELLDDLRRDPSAQRRKILIATAAVVVAGVAVAGFVKATAQAEVDCEAGRDRLAAHWDDDRREATRAAFDRTAVPYARPSWERATAELDSYVEAWGEMHVEACEATHVRGEQSADLLDRRMACLGKEELEFRALVDVLQEADADIVRNAVVAAQSLDPVSRCADAAALEPEALPSDPGLRDRVLALGKEIARVDALASAGKYTDADKIGAQVLADARDVGHAPTIWYATNTLARVRSALGHADEAMDADLQALEVAEASRLDYKRAVSLSDLSFVVGAHLGDLEQARWYARSAHAVLDRVGGADRQRAHLLSDEAIVETLAGNIETALKLGEEAVRIREEAGIENDLTLAVMRTNFGGALFAAGRHEEALAQYEASFAIRKEQLGAWHPTMAVSLENLGNCLQALGRFEEALENHRAALEMTQAANVTGTKLAGQFNNVAVALFGMERYDESREYYLKAIEAYQGSTDKHPALGVALSNLGELEVRTGRLDEARRRYEAALQLFDATVPPEHPWRTLAMTGLGSVLVDTGESERALALLRRSTEILAATPVDPMADEEAKLHLGRAIWEVEPEHRARARELVEGAEAALAKLGERAAVPLQTARQWLAAHPL